MEIKVQIWMTIPRRHLKKISHVRFSEKGSNIIRTFLFNLHFDAGKIIFMNKYVFIPLILTSSWCFAQQDLKELYDSARQTSNLQLAKEVNSGAKLVDDKRILANSYFLIAYLQKKDEKLYEAVSNYFDALSIYRTLNDVEQAAHVTENIANIYNITGFHDKALDYYYDVIQARTLLNDTTGLMKVHSAAGLQLQELSRNDEALEHYQKALEMAQLTSSKPRMYWIYNNIGRINRHKMNFSEAKAAYETALKFASNDNDIGELYNNMGYLYLTFKDTVTAHSYLNKSLELLTDNMFIGTAYTNLAYIYETTNADSSQLFFEKSYSFFKDHRMAMSEEYFEVCKKLKALNTQKGHYKKALSYSDDIDKLTEEVLDLRVHLNDMYNQYQVEAATYKYQSEEKARALAKQQQIDQYIKWALAVLAAILVTLSFTLYRKNRKIRFAQDTARKIYQVIHS